jgi:hypothetical protein
MWNNEAKWKRYFGDHGRQRDEVAEKGLKGAHAARREDWQK